MAKDRDKGLWTLSYYYVDKNNQVSQSNTGSYTFQLNPDSISYTPVQRVSIQDTFGGTAVIPWSNPDSNLYGGYSRMNLTISGVSNVFAYKGQTSTQGVMFDNTYLKKGALKIYQIAMQPLVIYDSSGNALTINWKLDWATPMFSRIDPSEPLKKLTLIGFITDAMKPAEKASNPFMPTWSFTFTIFDGEIDTFMQNIGALLV